jgi:hypothetical protein
MTEIIMKGQPLPIDVLNRKKRIAVALCLIGSGVVLLSRIFHHYLERERLGVIPLAAFLLTVFGILLFQVGLRCPNCRKSLSEWASKGGLFSFPRRMTTCPFCQEQLAGQSLFQERKKVQG